jgi:hypothetical protein
MTAILFDSTAACNPAPRTFGHGIPSGRRQPFIPDVDDLAWAAACFGQLEQARLRDEENRELERRAGEAEWLDRFHASVAAGRCVACGDRCDDLTVHGLCDRCDLAAVEGSTTNQPRSFPGAL